MESIKLPMVTAAALSEAAILKILEEFTQTGFSIQDFCFLKEGLDEATLQGWLSQYMPEGMDDEDDGFVSVRVKEERQKPGPKKQPALFARKLTS
ncbi:hypothetical protein SAMN05216436_101243 [bacterium A37T11]|nr:hypothetical protein SAMN05216436_101243 [bacterium A37T11]